MAKKILYIDMDGVIVDFESALPKLSEHVINEYFENLDEVPNIFSLMIPLEKSIESVIELTKYFDVYILSSSPWENSTALNDKLNWIKKYFGEHLKKRVIFSHNKHLNIGSYLIDDRKKNGAEKFTGEHLHFGSNLFPNWDSIIEYLVINKRYE